MALTPAQCRAARAWLGWNQAELAEKASVGVSTIRSLEDGTRTPIVNNAASIRRALEDGGAAFLLVATDGKDAAAPKGGGSLATSDRQSPGAARGESRARGARSRHG
jgi:ribosome-binding protein aMBF1 (putative translation factor)